MVLCEGEESDVFADARRLREEIFIEGQDIPVEADRDDLDGVSRHGVLYRDGEAVGVVRLRELRGVDGEEGDWVKVERVGISKEHRWEGLGTRLMGLVESVVRNEYAGKRITLNAQEDVVGWYERQGYEPIGEPFEEAGIPHRKMTKQP